MGPQSEGGPSGEGRGRKYSGQQYTEDGRRYQADRHIDQQLPRPNGVFASDNRLAVSPSGSASGRERDKDGDSQKNSGERKRSRTRNGRTASGQLRMCKKCGEPLTGQFVRALDGTFHLDCFRCRVRELQFFVDTFANKS
jgi:hypothetical protein